MVVFLKKGIAILLSLVMLFAVCGCSVIDNFKKASETPKPEKETNEQESIKDNSITIGVVELDTYNPLVTKSVTMKNMLGFIFEPLFTLDENQNTVGVLAETCETSPDGKSIIIKLKQNVIWHDGALFTANDVVYTVKAILNSETNYGHLLENVASVSASDTQTVNVAFKRSVPEPALLMTFPVIKSGSLSGTFRAIGTGPFYLDYDKLSRFDSYYGKKAKLDCVKVKSIPDNDKFISLFNASVVDIADSEMIDMTEYTPRSNANVHGYVSDEMVFVGFNTNDDVFRYPEARRSVYAVIDRQNIASHIYFSRAEAAHYPMNPTRPFYPKTTENMHSDHGTAEKELRDGKWQKDKRGVYFRSNAGGVTYFGVEILVNSEDKERMKIAAEISDTMTDLGMRNTITTCSEAEFKTRVLNGNYDMFVGKTELLPNNDLTDFLLTDNIFGYSDEEAEILLSQLGTLTTDEDKESVYGQLFELLKEKCPIAPVCFLKDSLITSAKLKSGVSPSVTGAVVMTGNWSVK
ncbi:MAG: hypothetical protein IJC09_04785 [Clostridia bacterium]|nr:hypothetical protein [Clostridia bacterium]